MGFPKVAKYYYYPGWHEPGSVLELFINKTAFLGLPKDLQAIVRAAALRANGWMLSEFEAQNFTYLLKIKEEFNTQVLRFPDDVLAGFKRYAAEIIDEVTAGDPMSREVYASFDQFRKKISNWAEITEKAYYEVLGG